MKTQPLNVELKTYVRRLQGSMALWVVVNPPKFCFCLCPASDGEKSIKVMSLSVFYFLKKEELLTTITEMQ